VCVKSATYCYDMISGVDHRGDDNQTALHFAAKYRKTQTAANNNSGDSDTEDQPVMQVVLKALLIC